MRTEYCIAGVALALAVVGTGCGPDPGCESGILLQFTDAGNRPQGSFRATIQAIGSGQERELMVECILRESGIEGDGWRCGESGRIFFDFMWADRLAIQARSTRPDEDLSFVGTVVLNYEEEYVDNGELIDLGGADCEIAKHYLRMVPTGEADETE